MNRSPSCEKIRGFTLIEMLVVVTIIAVLLAVVVPGVSGMLDSTRLSSAGGAVTGMLLEAQQVASSRGRPVELRLYRKASQGVEKEEFNSVMILTHYVKGESDPSNLSETLDEAVSLVEGNGAYILPDDLIFHPATNYSSLLGSKTSGSRSDSKLVLLRDGKLEDYKPENLSNDYHTFLFLPEGTNLPPDEKWFLTIVQSRGGLVPDSLPKNFYSVQINPVTSNVSVYRP